MYDELENIIRELNPSCHIGEYRDRIIELFKNENGGGEKVQVENFVMLAIFEVMKDVFITQAGVVGLDKKVIDYANCIKQWEFDDEFKELFEMRIERTKQV